MAITQEPTPPESLHMDETSIFAQAPENLNPTQGETLMSDPQFRQSLRDLSQAVASENARDVDESRKSTPVPIEDSMLLMRLSNAETIKDLASLVASSYAARDVYELHKPVLIWNTLLKCLGPDGVNDLLICAYLDGECSPFDLGSDGYVGRAIQAWKDGVLYPSWGVVPDADVVESMLCHYLGITNVVNRLLAQRHCFRSAWAQVYGDPLFNKMQHMTESRPIWEQNKPIDMKEQREQRLIYRIFSLAYIVCQAWDRRDPIHYRQGAKLFSSISDDEVIGVCRLLYRLGCCKSVVNDDGPVGEMVKIFHLVRGTRPMYPNEAKLEAVILGWVKPHLTTEDILEPIEQ